MTIEQLRDTPPRGTEPVPAGEPATADAVRTSCPAGEAPLRETASPQDARSEGPSPISFTAEEVSRTFDGLLATFDFKAQLEEIGLGPLHFIKRARARLEFIALSIALWKLALDKSFPQDARLFFRHYMDTAPFLQGESKPAKELRGHITTYVSLMVPKGDADFSAVSEHLAANLGCQDQDMRRQRLKLSLIIRSLYAIIFNNLIKGL